MRLPAAPPPGLIPDWSPELREEDLTRAQKLALLKLPLLVRTQILDFMRLQAAQRDAAAAKAQAEAEAAEADAPPPRKRVPVLPILVGALLSFLAQPVQKAIRAFHDAKAYARGTKPRLIAEDDPTPLCGSDCHYRLEIAYDAFCEHRPEPKKLFRKQPWRRDLDSWCDAPNSWTSRRKPKCHHCATAHAHYTAARDTGDAEAERALYELAREGAARLDAERRRYRFERRPINAAIRDQRKTNPNPMPAHFDPELWAEFYQHRGSHEKAHHRDRREVERELVKAYERHIQRNTQQKRTRLREKERRREAAAPSTADTPSSRATPRDPRLPSRDPQRHGSRASTRGDERVNPCRMSPKQQLQPRSRSPNPSPTRHFAVLAGMAMRCGANSPVVASPWQASQWLRR